MLIGDTVAGRFVARRWRGRLATPLQLLLAVPYLLFAARPALPLAYALSVLASVGFSASLLYQERLMALTPDEYTGQALGLHSSGMLTMQGVAATLAGTIAQRTSPATAMTVMAAASVAVTLALAAAGRRAAGATEAVDSLAPHGTSEAVDSLAAPRASGAEDGAGPVG